MLNAASKPGLGGTNLWPAPAGADLRAGLANRLDDLGGAEATGANLHALGAAGLSGTHPPDVGLELTVGDVVGVADPVSGNRGLSANFTRLGHRFCSCLAFCIGSRRLFLARFALFRCRRNHAL